MTYKTYKVSIVSVATDMAEEVYIRDIRGRWDTTTKCIMWYGNNIQMWLWQGGAASLLPPDTYRNTGRPRGPIGRLYGGSQSTLWWHLLPPSSIYTHTSCCCSCNYFRGSCEGDARPYNSLSTNCDEANLYCMSCLAKAVREVTMKTSSSLMSTMRAAAGVKTAVAVDVM